MNYNDVYYVAALIEYVSRKTKNRRRYVVKKIGMEGIRHLLEDANANHCLSIGQVSEEVVEDYGIEMGEFDSVGKCQYKVPGYLPIGKNYARLVEDVESNPERYPEALYEVLCSPISDAMSDFNSSFFYAGREEIAYAYQNAKEGA
jgi:hypothetical protein